MQLKLIDTNQITNNIYSLVFERPTNFQFYPGQYLDFKLDVVDPNGSTRAFTISSAPTENLLMITVKEGLSPFKSKLLSLRKNEVVEASHPAGTFCLDEKSPAVMIAGGIGITPFRSMLKYALDQGLKIPIALVYSNANKNFLFATELAAWEKEMPNLSIIYHNSSTSGHLSHKSLIVNPKSIYYLAGSHSFVDAMEKVLLELGVDPIDIRFDRFDGY